MLQSRVQVALARAQVCLLNSAMLLANVAMPNAPKQHLRHACLELLPAILLGAAALLGPGPGADAEAVVERHHVLAYKVLVSALPWDRQGLRHFFCILAATVAVGGQFRAMPK